MAEECDGQSKSQNEKPEDYPRPNESHCEFLRRILQDQDTAKRKWNKWRRENPSIQIFLEGCDLTKAYLHRFNFTNTSLAGAQLQSANLTNANLMRANLYGVELPMANLHKANLGGTNSESANFQEAHLPGANLGEANLKRAKLMGADLSDASLRLSNLQDAKLLEADLRGAHFVRANLRGSDFSRARVDGGTLIWECDIDDSTKFEGVGLGNIRIYPETRQILEHNIRCMNWRKWYRGESENKWIIRGRKLLTSPMRWFWWVSNYGLSTKRILLTFLVFSMIFATIYFIWGAVDYYCLDIKDQPGIVNDLFVPVAERDKISETHYSAMIYLRSVYFSVVTMTTLGFGDMYANATRFGPRWWAGHFMLVAQVILGYVLLGALVTRFAVLFTAGGPVGKFAKRTKEKAR